MKKLFFLLSFLFFVTIVNYSCKDECKDVVCNNGICDTGNCNCDFGWEGEVCDVKKISFFYGDWEGEVNCINNGDTIVMHIEDLGNSLNILKMHTIGLVFDFNSIPISFDSYILNAVADSNFYSFVIDTLNIKQVVPIGGNNFELDIAITGNGKKNANDNLDLTIDLNIPSINQKISCVGELIK